MMVLWARLRLGDFNSQPREGGWIGRPRIKSGDSISTHSRAKAAGCALRRGWIGFAISTHSRAKAAG